MKPQSCGRGGGINLKTPGQVKLNNSRNPTPNPEVQETFFLIRSTSWEKQIPLRAFESENDDSNHQQLSDVSHRVPCQSLFPPTAQMLSFGAAAVTRRGGMRRREDERVRAGTFGREEALLHLRVRDLGGFLRQAAALRRDQVVVLGADVLV